MRNLKVIAAGTLAGLGTMVSTASIAGTEASAGISTEYIFRGVELGSPQVWGGLDWSSDVGVYAGTWISSTAAGNEEVDVYGGYALDAGAVGLDFGAIYYAFPSEEVASQNLNVTEVYAGLTAGGFSGYLWIAPGGFEGVDDDEYAYLDLNLDIPLSDTVSIGTHVGATQPNGDAFDATGPNGDDLDEVFFDFGVSFNVSDFYIALTYLEESDASTNFTGGNGSDNPSISAGYSWSFGDIFN